MSNSHQQEVFSPVLNLHLNLAVHKVRNVVNMPGKAHQPPQSQTKPHLSFFNWRLAEQNASKGTEGTVPKPVELYSESLTNYSESVAHLGMKISAHELPTCGSLISICNIEAKTPHEFYFRILSMPDEVKLLLNDMKNFYSVLHEDKYKIPLQCIMPQLYCAACICGDWLRAEVISPVKNCNMITVKAIDVGITTEVKYSNLKFLLRRLTKLPAQALCGSLAYLKPNNGSNWSSDSRKYFQKLTTERILYGRVTAHDRMKNITYLILCEPKDDSTKCINVKLLQMGMAK